MSASVYTLARERWVKQVRRIADGGYYSNVRRWENYFRDHIEPMWQARIGSGGEDLIESLALTDTMLGMILLIGRGYRRHGMDHRAPCFRDWPPHIERDGTLRFYHAFPIRDIARLLGRSTSAVKTGIARFRGKSAGDCQFALHRLIGVPPLPSGILLDLVLTREDQQLGFAFDYQDYTASKMWAVGKGVDDDHVRRYTRGWTREGIQNVAPGLLEPESKAELIELFPARTTTGLGA